MSGELPHRFRNIAVTDSSPNTYITPAISRTFNPHSHKRPASPDSESECQVRKRMKEDTVDSTPSGSTLDSQVSRQTIDGHALAEDLAQELQCGCCSELVYKPVVVIPCDHFFCGSCCTLWIKNGGTNCPACRTLSTAVLPSRTIQSMVDILLRAAPHRQRTERERQQADEIYPELRPFRIPAPREPSPEPTLPPSSNFLQPCPYCRPNSHADWVCPYPIPNPTDAENAWHISNGSPPGHSFCGNCESVLALHAPTTTRCDFCRVFFCGINIPSRCRSLELMSQSPDGLSEVAELLESSEVYDCFENNHAEVDLMIDYIMRHSISPKHIYRQIITYIQTQPNRFRPLFELDLFSDIHPISGDPDPDPSASRHRICRQCAAEVFVFGLRDWWIRERRKATEKGLLPPRPDCPEGIHCDRSESPAHAKEFNHLFDHSHFDEQTLHEELLSGPSREPGPSLPHTEPAYTPLVSLPSIADLDIPIPNFGTSQNSLSIFTRPEIAELASVEPFPRFVHGLHEHIGQEASSSTSYRSRQQSQDIRPSYELPEGTRADYGDDLLIEPSSSQSRQSVEVSLGPIVSSGYDSDQGINDYQGYQEDFNDSNSSVNHEDHYIASLSSDQGSGSSLQKVDNDIGAHTEHTDYPFHREVKADNGSYNRIPSPPYQSIIF